MNKIKSFLNDLWNILRLPEMLILPGNLAFYLILSVAPIITLFGLIASYLSISTGSIASFIQSVFPSQIVEIIMPFLNRVDTGNIIVMILGFFVASNGADSIIVASNILYKNSNQNYIFRRIKAFVVTFWLLVLFVITLLFIAFGNLILSKVMIGSIGKFINNYYLIINIIKYLISIFTIFIAIKIVYTMSLNIKSKYVNKGAIFSTLSIVLITSCYSFYVTNTSKYDLLYGSLSNIVILMFLIYLISYVIVLGIAINHNYYKNNN